MFEEFLADDLGSPNLHRASERGDFGAAEERQLEIALAATPSERLRWLEEALMFAARMRARQLE